MICAWWLTQWFEPYLKLLENRHPNLLLNNWDRFEQQLFTLFGDPNEVCNTEFELNSLSMKETGKASTYISQFRVLQSQVEWNDAAFAFHFRKGLPSRITDHLAISGQRLSTLQQLIDRTIELDNCYHDKVQSKKTDHPQQHKADDPSKTSSKSSNLAKSTSKPSTSSTSKPKSQYKPEYSNVLNKDGGLNQDERARREKEGLCMYCGGKHQLETCAKKIAREAAKLSKN